MSEHPSDMERLMFSSPEGVYTFKAAANQSGSVPYSEFDENDILSQQGQYMDQYTAVFQAKDGQRQAILNVRFSPKLFQELI